MLWAMSTHQTIVRGESGGHVKAYQVALETLGHDLPRYGADGDAGGETFSVTEEFTKRHGLEFDDLDDEIPARVVELVHEYAAPPTGTTGTDWPGLWLHDFRDIRTDRIGRKRRWSDVTGITFHQTACCFLSDLDPDEAKLKRALARVAKVRAHFVGLRCGDFAYNAPLDRRMSHGHAFNRHDVGIEIDGYYGGVHDDLATFWRPKSRPNRKPMVPTPVQVENARAVCRYIVETVAANGGEVLYIHAHRQTHRGKPSDPGELIWRDVALWCKAELGLTDEGPDYYVPHHSHKKRGGLSSKAGPGRPIPKQWDPDNTWDYRKRPKK